MCDCQTITKVQRVEPVVVKKPTVKPEPVKAQKKVRRERVVA